MLLNSSVRYWTCRLVKILVKKLVFGKDFQEHIPQDEGHSNTLFEVCVFLGSDIITLGWKPQQNLGRVGLITVQFRCTLSCTCAATSSEANTGPQDTLTSVQCLTYTVYD